MNLGKALLSSASAFIPPTIIGEFFQGGYYFGVISISGTQYALLLADKASEITKLYTPGVSGATSNNDGALNTSTLVSFNAGDFAANYCDSYSSGGYTDWYLPAKNELELMYRNLKPTTASNSTSSGTNPDSVPTGATYTVGVPAQTPLALFQSSGAQAIATTSSWWSSTETDLSNAMSQVTTNGLQSPSTSKSTSRLVRPVRKVRIS